MPTSSPNSPAPRERIVDIDVALEMESSFLEYAYSVIYSRALPDARDGLKPVQRRILFGMDDMGLRPDRGHVKSQRIVGEVMGKWHPHGDAAIYDALVRLAQPFSLRLPLVDGHGNFGSLDDGPAAARYTEARPAPSAMLLIGSLDEDVVDFVPNFDSQLLQPGVLPAAFPNLLVNGASGIAVGMATNIPPHNLVETISAARHLLDHPDATLDELMEFVPGPDLPTGGMIVGTDGIRDAYTAGRGTFKMRATVQIEDITARRQGLVITELPYLVGPEKIKEKVRDAVQSKKLQGIADIVDLTDRKNGTKLVIECKAGFNPRAVLAALYKLTPLEESFGINNVCLVDGSPQTLGLRDMLRVFLHFRIDVVRRRTQFRLNKHSDRLHLVQGLLVAIADIDRVIAIIRAADDAGAAKADLISEFALSDAQAEYILELRLRRLTKFSRIELETERTELEAIIAELTELLSDEARLRQLVSRELQEVSREHGTPRRTRIVEADAVPAATVNAPLQIEDKPCHVVLSATGMLARTADQTLPSGRKRGPHDVLIGAVPSTTRGTFGVVTSVGRVVRTSTVELREMAAGTSLSAAPGSAVTDYAALARGERAVGLVSLRDDTAGLALGTKNGVVKRVTGDYPSKGEWSTIALADGDEVVRAVELESESTHLAFITSSAQVLHYPADLVRPQGRGGKGVAGIKCGADNDVVWFGALDPGADAVVATVVPDPDALPGTGGQRLAVAPLSEFAAQGRATAGIRAMRLPPGQQLIAAAAGPDVRGCTQRGKALRLPAANSSRDTHGDIFDDTVAYLAPNVTEINI